MLDNETIKTLMQEKSILQIIWIVIFAFFLAIVKVFYLEIKKTYSIIRSVILSVSAGLIAGLICYHFWMPYIPTLIIVSLASFAGKMFWDGVTTEFPRVFRTVLESYLRKWK